MRVIDVAGKRKLHFEMKQRELKCSILITLAGFVIATNILAFQISFELSQLYHYIVAFFLLIYFSFNLYSNN
ncbi:MULTISPECIES: hypothetical protein [Bacillus cereus group]|uniref:Uncharacterized protein n=1 Tax=Bacillus cereus TaxID=1396 RepID=A0A1Q4L484_BACCE|nr:MULTISPECIES: hypothetical protein [Bacillus cereus group]EJP83534.1 hypothetical protein IAU_05514 [Bacillus cereus IS075]EOO82397.1 hypothetical protein IGS_05754 [Bacillus cereus IS845/00]EOO92600.1 hypothetical protein IGQ_05807 [Bacillus cereus IS195]EHL65197.1 hypothetical protein HMPREF1014_05504 [Bacillus sp. 7_6_55CFAA_CT2]MDX5927821.1 hypothetical protein [Bacillus cereus group sp. BfR-BA-00967]